MKAVVTSLLVFLCTKLFALDSNTEKLKAALKAGNKVYVVAEKPVMVKYASKKLRNSCWQITQNLSEANFVLKFDGNRWFAHAEIFDPATKEQLYKTPTSNTMASMTFNAKKKVVKKIINKHIKPMCDEKFFDKLEFRAKDTF